MFIGTLAVICLSSFTVAAFPQTAVDNAWTVLHTGLSDKSTSNRSVAVRLLGLLENNPKALELALQALTDQKSDVRAASAGALGQMNAKSAIPKLQDLINTEKDSAVIITAAHSLIQLGDSIGFNVYYADLTGERKFGQGLLEEQKKMLNDPKKMARIGFEQAIGFVTLRGDQLHRLQNDQEGQRLCSPCRCRQGACR
jgi:hypothetical protein